MCEFVSRFSEIDSVFADKISSRFTSPVYLMDVVGLRRRFLEFQRETQALYSNSVIAISYKTNPLHGLLALLHKHSAYAEVVSGDEYRIARSLNVVSEMIGSWSPSNSSCCQRNRPR